MHFRSPKVKRNPVNEESSQNVSIFNLQLSSHCPTQETVIRVYIKFQCSTRKLPYHRIICLKVEFCLSHWKEDYQNLKLKVGPRWSLVEHLCYSHEVTPAVCSLCDLSDTDSLFDKR